MIYFKRSFSFQKISSNFELLLEGSKVSLETKVLTLNKREERERKKERQAALTLRSFLSTFFFYMFFLSTWSSSSVVTARKLEMKSLCFYCQQDQF